MTYGTFRAWLRHFASAGRLASACDMSEAWLTWRMPCRSHQSTSEAQTLESIHFHFYLSVLWVNKERRKKEIQSCLVLPFAYPAVPEARCPDKRPSDKCPPRTKAPNRCPRRVIHQTWGICPRGRLSGGVCPTLLRLAVVADHLRYVKRR